MLILILGQLRFMARLLFRAYRERTGAFISLAFLLAISNSNFGLAIAFPPATAGNGVAQGIDTPEEDSPLAKYGPLEILTTSLPDGNPNVPYRAQAQAAGGSGAHAWRVVGGQLPQGLTLSPNGLISGVPTAAGQSSFTLSVSTGSPKGGGTTVTGGVTLNVASPAPTDPQLPQTFIHTSFPVTKGYAVVPVAAGANLQSAIDSASCHPVGAVLRLASGARFKGRFILRAKTCAPGQWIIIQTDLPDSKLPNANARISPAYSPVLAKVTSPDSMPTFSTESQANHYWLMGLEIDVDPAAALSYGIVSVGNGETSLAELPHHIVIDRCYIHGNAKGNIKRGVGVDGAFISVLNSYISNIHSTEQDTQAVVGWNGSGPIKVVNNYLEAAGENILFGGGDPHIPNLVPADIEIRYNHFFKPLTWEADDPSFAGILWSVKNLLEFKNAQRVLVEGNILENNWAQAQSGYAVLFTPRNQGGTCPWCAVRDINFRYNIVRHSGSGITISGEDGTNPPSGPAHNIDIHDDLLTDINGPAWGGADGRMMLLVNANPGVTSAAILPPTNIRVNHLTSFQSSAIVFVGDSLVDPMPNFVFTNNLAPHHAYGIFGSAAGIGNPAIALYFSAPVITGNLFVGLPSGTTLSKYPAGNFAAADYALVGFVDFANGDYRLLPTSPYSGAGTDGEDIGADVSAVNAATAGVAP